MEACPKGATGRKKLEANIQRLVNVNELFLIHGRKSNTKKSEN